MPLVPHSGASAGAPDPEQGARNLFNAASWIYRRCNEIAADATLDPVKIYDLAGKCQGFRAEADKWISGPNVTLVRQALVDLTRQAGAGNVVKTDAEINADYNALYAAVGAFLTWATANLPPVGQSLTAPVVTVERLWPQADFSVRIVKQAAVTTQVTALRAVFV